MANVFRRLFSTDTGITVDLVYSNAGVNANGLAPFDVVGVQYVNPGGIQSRLVLTNNLGQEARKVLAQTDVPVNIPAPPALQMVEVVNYHGVTVLTLSDGASISLQTR